MVHMKALIIVLIIIILILVGAIVFVLLGYGGQAPADTDTDNNGHIATYEPYTPPPDASLDPNSNTGVPSDPNNPQTPDSGNNSDNGSTSGTDPDSTLDGNETPPPDPTSQETEEQLNDRRNIMLMQAEEHYMAGRYAEALALLRKDSTLFNDDTERLEAEVLAAMGN